MERVMHAQITDYFLSGGLFCPMQHGFQKGRSTVSNLLESTTDWIFAADDRLATDVFYLDLSRAFDSVTYSKLLRKLMSYGISGELLSWLTVFLIDRNQMTVVDGVYSSAVKLMSGVPQGSVLGPLLFNIYINDLGFFMKLVKVNPSGIKLFADDIKVYKIINSIRDAIHLQFLINTVNQWCDIWQLKINKSKCLILHIGSDNLKYVYHISGFRLSSPNLVRDLGVLIDSSLTFRQHISQLAQKARTRCVLFLKVFVSRDPTTMVVFYYIRQAPSRIL